MATSSSSKLTKYVSASTIVTADVANSWYGGLYGSSEGDALDPSDPRVAGHLHDGGHSDGHTSKIDLVDHVTGKLRHINLADEAVYKNNVASFLNVSNAIPEYRIVDGNKYYYLDLTYVYDAIGEISLPFEVADDGYTADNVIRQTDTDYTSTGLNFVVGSSQLDDLAHPSGWGDERLLFDKSKGAFRAGSVQSNQWDDINRGLYSVAFGLNNIASGQNSFASGTGNTASDDTTFASGKDNVVQGYRTAAFGRANNIQGSENFTAGYQNKLFNNGGVGPSPANANNSVAFGLANEVRSFNSAAIGNGNILYVEAESAMALGKGHSIKQPFTAAIGLESAPNNIFGEFSHAAGKFSIAGDAQTTEYVVRLESSNPLFNFASGVLTAGLLQSYQIEDNYAYNVEAHIIGKETGRQSGAAFIIKGTVFGADTTSAAPPAVFLASREILYRGATLNLADCDLFISTNFLQVRVQTLGSINPNNSRWVATVKITRVKF
jgi:hypothetical protein